MIWFYAILILAKNLYLFPKDEEGPEVRGGAIDALIVHATQAGKIGESILKCILICSTLCWVLEMTCTIKET